MKARDLLLHGIESEATKYREDDFFLMFSIHGVCRPPRHRTVDAGVP